jgi:hypothetical protein
MDTELIVREARGDEVELPRDILVRAFKEYEGRLDPPSGVHSETLLSLQNKLKEGGALICEVGGVVAGCVFYAPRTGYLYVGRLAVIPEYRRGGSETSCCGPRSGVQASSACLASGSVSGSPSRGFARITRRAGIRLSPWGAMPGIRNLPTRNGKSSVMSS